ncbi:MAG: hypothetical protein GTN76_04275 [Candidatus Aenigmarchaeota archaeon]|nr:hypothetical protein [Candidatus Aenigmarchaeota archaeon]
MEAGMFDAHGCCWEGCKRVSTGTLNIDEEFNPYCHEHYQVIRDKYFVEKDKFLQPHRRCDFKGCNSYATSTVMQKGKRRYYCLSHTKVAFYDDGEVRWVRDDSFYDLDKG